MGLVGMLMLAVLPNLALNLVLGAGSGARAYAKPYLTVRALTLMPALLSTVGFAAFRGTMDVVTPLKISLLSNLINCLLDPFLIFTCGMGVSGAAAATCVAEVISFLLYMKTLVSKKMLSLSKVMKIPSFSALKPMLLGGLGVQLRAVSLNIAFLAVTKTTQGLDSTGIAAAGRTSHQSYPSITQKIKNKLKLFSLFLYCN